MNTRFTSLNGTPRRHRQGRPLALYTTPPLDRTAAAMDDAAEAERLIEDLLALVDAGLLAPIDFGGQIRYAPVDEEPDDLPAA
jgi:hypothetical protein